MKLNSAKHGMETARLKAQSVKEGARPGLPLNSMSPESQAATDRLSVEPTSLLTGHSISTRADGFHLPDKQV
jgi:hypothetical protein